MTAAEFAYWLQGFFELTAAGQQPLVGLQQNVPAGPMPLTSAQVDMIQRHLALVFVHDLDPKAGGAKVQGALNAIHSGVKRC